VTEGTDRELFPVERSQEGGDASCFLLAHRTNMADMMHFRGTRVSTDATGHPPCGAGSQTNALLEQVGWRTGLRKPVALLCPVAVVVECDLTFLGSISGGDGGDGAEALEDVAEGAFVFRRQRMGKGECENILDAGEARKVICKAIVQLQSSVHTAVPEDELASLCIYPCLFRGWVSRGGTEPFGMESCDEIRKGYRHDGF